MDAQAGFLTGLPQHSSTRAAGTSFNQNFPRSGLLAVDSGPPLHPCSSSFISNIPLGCGRTGLNSQQQAAETRPPISLLVFFPPDPSR